MGNRDKVQFVKQAVSIFIYLLLFFFFFVCSKMSPLNIGQEMICLKYIQGTTLDDSFDHLKC